MHYVFKSRAAADLLMMAGVGDRLLRIIGKEPARQGIIEMAAIPAAIRALEQALAAEDELTRQAKVSKASKDDDEDFGAGVRLGLRQRAWPMLEMMKRSIAARADIVWGV
ncbi:MAG: DUF1840 domain-containing protein [Caldimonas sp.]